MRRHSWIPYPLALLVLCTVIIYTYAFLAHELTKVDVSGPDPDGPVIVPENYKNLLALDVTIPPFDAGPAVEDIKLHNGVAGSYPRDILLPFNTTDWYSDHDGDVSFDGNQVSGNTEVIISSSDDMLDSSDNVIKTGLCLMELFDYSGGMGEQYIDSNHSDGYDDGEAVVRTATSSGEIYPGEAIRGGAADMTVFPANIRFTDGINGNLAPIQYHDGEAIISSNDGLLDSGDAVLIPGDADLRPFPDSVVYLDSNGDNVYGSADEAIIEDVGTQGQLDAGMLDGTGVDTVLRAGTADLRPMDGEGLLFADHDGDDGFSSGELIVASGDLIVDAGEVKLPGLANLKPMTGLAFADDNDNSQLNPSDLIVKNTGAYDDILEAADTIVSPGKADLRAFDGQRFVDNNGNGVYNDGECMIQNGDGDLGLLTESDAILRPGAAFLTAFGTDIKWADANSSGQYDDDELIVNTADGILSAGEVVKPGFCDLQSLSDDHAGQVYSDNDNSGTHSVDELVITSGDKILDGGDAVVTSGTACMLSLIDDSSTRYIDNDGNKGFDPDEAIVYDRSGGVPILDDGDGIARSGPVDIKSLQDVIVYIDHNGDGDFKGDSDNDVNWDDADDETWANDPDVIADQDEVVLNDPAGSDHLALSPDDTVLRPGLASLTDFTANEVYTDSGNGEYDGNASNEAIIRDSNANLILEATDVVIASGTALIRDFDPPTGQKYIDANNDSSFTSGEAIIIDNGTNRVLDAGPLDGTGTDQVVTSGVAMLVRFRGAEKFVDGNRDGTYNAGEAVVYDWYKSDTLEGESILAGDPTSNPPTGSLAYLAPGSRTHDSVLLASDPGSAGMTELNDDSEHIYVDNDHSGVYDGFYTGTYEPILWSANDQLEEGDLDGTGTDRVLAAGYACMRTWKVMWDGTWTENIKWADDDHDGEYQNNEAIIYDAADDYIITIIGTDSGDDQIIVAGAADLSEFPKIKYIDANSNSVFDEGELKINDLNGDDMIQNNEIQEPGPVPFLLAFSSASDDYRFCDPNGNSTFDPNEAIIMDLSALGILEAGDQVVTAGTIVLQSFSAATDRYADSDHDGQYDYSEVNGFGEAIIADTTGYPDLVEAGETESDGYADLQAFDGTGYRYSDADRDDEYTDGELIVNDDGDDSVETGEVVCAGLANLKLFSADIMYLDTDGDDEYTIQEAVLRTGDTVLDSGDEVLASGTLGFHSFEENIYRFADADHDDACDSGEAIVVESGWGIVDDILEDSDIVILEGNSDVEQFPSSFMFLDDGTNSDTYDVGEAIVNDSNSNDLLEHGEVVTGGRAALKAFPGGARYTDGGAGANARNSQYDSDEAIVRDGNSNGELDIGSLDGTGTDKVMSAGKAELTHFASDERYVDNNENSKYDGGQYVSEDIYLDIDSNGVVTIGDDALDYFVVENSGTATSSDLSAVYLWADRDDDGHFEPDTDDAPALASLIPDASNPRIWYEGPATAPPLSSVSSRAFIDYNIPIGGQRFFVTIDTGSIPTDGHDIQMGLPVNGVKTVFGSSSPSDSPVVNAYTQKVDFADPHTAEITSPEANDVVHGTITLQAAASDTIQVGKVEFYNGPPGGSNTPIAVDDDGAPWEVLWDSSTLDFGNHTLYARVYDRTYLRPPQTWGIDHYTDSPGVTITIAASYSVELVGGWNLISVPVEASNTSINLVLSAIDYAEVWAYDATVSEWLRYDLTDPEAAFLNDLDTIQAGIGYWILMSNPDTLNIDGAIPETGIPLQEGWNLVGYNSLTPLNVVEATSSIECDFEVWTFDSTSSEWLKYDPDDPPNDLSTIEAGRGYWIHTSESCIWNMD